MIFFNNFFLQFNVESFLELCVACVRRISSTCRAVARETSSQHQQKRVNKLNLFTSLRVLAHTTNVVDLLIHFEKRDKEEFAHEYSKSQSTFPWTWELACSPKESPIYGIKLPRPQTHASHPRVQMNRNKSSECKLFVVQFGIYQIQNSCVQGHKLKADVWVRLGKHNVTNLSICHFKDSSHNVLYM